VDRRVRRIVLMPAGTLAFWVMDATADDWESLEQIHPHVNQWWQQTEASVVVVEMMRLLGAGLFEVMPATPENAAAVLAEPIQYWFRMTPVGRAQWKEQAKTVDIDSVDRPPA
jgi:hypothetical protein